ncbi:MAG: ATP-binding cassette domain-containing protein [Tissierella sp.]
MIGANGSGKTTIIKCLLNYYNDYLGDITILGEESKGIAQEDNTFAYIPNKAVYYEELTVEEHLDFMSKMYRTEERVEKLIKDFQLESHLNKFPHELSRGNQQKLSISCALLRDYKLLLADERFSGLDPR